MVRAGIQSKQSDFDNVIQFIYDASELTWFKDFIVDEGFESIIDIEIPCPKVEYMAFIKHQIGPITCKPFRIFKFQAEVLQFIFESPALIERLKIEYGLNTATSL